MPLPEHACGRVSASVSASPDKVDRLAGPSNHRSGGFTAREASVPGALPSSNIECMNLCTPERVRVDAVIQAAVDMEAALFLHELALLGNAETPDVIFGGSRIT